MAGGGVKTLLPSFEKIEGMSIEHTVFNLHNTHMYGNKDERERERNCNERSVLTPGNESVYFTNIERNTEHRSN